ncbi:MAG TPA: tetratricopeptide repeat protein [Xanthobacteraceae bacterium]|jgi:tetratricopeptide (TPR) repeat protein|nr:tetratricopeptide repeat protein [Xanthobacteraceae bacterium]
MIHATASAALLGVMVAAATYAAIGPASQEQARRTPADVVAGRATETEGWPICGAMESMTAGVDWARLDPDFAAGKKLLAAGDWTGAIAALTPAALRDARNADLQLHLGYAYRRSHQLDAAFRHYRQALTLNPRHRGAHAHMGEAFLAIGQPERAQEHLAALERICLIACEEYDGLKAAMAADRARRLAEGP